jgi:hypothetical protein
VKRRNARILVVLAIISLVVFVPAAFSSALQGDEAGVTETTIGFEPGREPAVVVSDGAVPADDPAWTFRYLVPTLMVVSGAALAGLVVWYGLGVKGRYRVAR